MITPGRLVLSSSSSMITPGRLVLSSSSSMITPGRLVLSSLSSLFNVRCPCWHVKQFLHTRPFHLIWCKAHSRCKPNFFFHTLITSLPTPTSISYYITGSLAGLGCVNGVSRSGDKTWNLNPLSKSQLCIDWLQIWRGWLRSQIH